MKRVHLTYDDDFYRAGYVNVDRFPRNEHQGEGDVSDLSWLLDAGEAAEVVAHRVLDRFPHSRRGAIVEGWASRLAPRGVLVLVGMDLYGVANRLETRRTTVAEANATLYGEAGPRGRYASMSTLLESAALLRAVGLEVVESRYDGDCYVLKGERP